jgi:hypothetical protein
MVNPFVYVDTSVAKWVISISGEKSVRSEISNVRNSDANLSWQNLHQTRKMNVIPQLLIFNWKKNASCDIILWTRKQMNFKFVFNQREEKQQRVFKNRQMRIYKCTRDKVVVK